MALISHVTPPTRTTKNTAAGWPKATSQSLLTKENNNGPDQSRCADDWWNHHRSVLYATRANLREYADGERKLHHHVGVQRSIVRTDHNFVGGRRDHSVGQQMGGAVNGIRKPQRRCRAIQHSRHTHAVQRWQRHADWNAVSCLG